MINECIPRPYNTSTRQDKPHPRQEYLSRILKIQPRILNNLVLSWSCETVMEISGLLRIILGRAILKHHESRLAASFHLHCKYHEIAVTQFLKRKIINYIRESVLFQERMWSSWTLSFIFTLQEVIKFFVPLLCNKLEHKLE